VQRFRYVVGDWIDVHGALEFAATGLLQGMVSLFALEPNMDPLMPNRRGGICFWFKQEWFDQLETLKPGDRVRVTGRIVSMTPYFMDVCDCELLPHTQEKSAA